MTSLTQTPAPAANASRPESGLADFSPSNFGAVMATGIVSIAAWWLGWRVLGWLLLVLNTGLYIVLWCLTLLRLLRHTDRFMLDLSSHLRGPGFFTLAAGTGVLASQYFVLLNRLDITLALWWLTAVLWLAVTYGVLALLTTKVSKPTLERGLNGSWLLAVVATQSLAVVATQLGGRSSTAMAAWHFVALVLWLWGGMLYIWLMTLIFYRYTFFKLTANDLTPTYWINMGAMAISTLAGSLLITNAATAPWLHGLLPFLKGFTLFYWASGSWWIPMLLVLGVWLYGVQRERLRYDPAYWGAVFPLGMYSACTFALCRALELDFLRWLPPLFGAAAVAAWALAFAGLLRRAGASLRSGR